MADFDHYKNLILRTQAERPKALRPFLEEFCSKNSTSKSALCTLAGLGRVSERELAKKIWGQNTGRFLAYPNFAAAAKDIKSKYLERPANLANFFTKELRGLIGISIDALRSLPETPEDTKFSVLAQEIWGDCQQNFDDLKTKVLRDSPERPSGPSIYFENMYKNLGVSMRDFAKALNKKRISNDELAFLIWGELKEKNLDEVLEIIKEKYPTRPSQAEAFFQDELSDLTGITRTRFRSMTSSADDKASTLADYIWGKEKELTLEEAIEKLRVIQKEKPENITEFFQGLNKLIGIGFTKVKRLAGDRKLTPGKFAGQVWADQENSFADYKKMILTDQPTRPEVCDYFFGKEFTGKYGIGMRGLLKLAGENFSGANKLGDLIWGEEKLDWEETKQTVLKHQATKPNNLSAYFKKCLDELGLGQVLLKKLAGLSSEDRGLVSLGNAIWGEGPAPDKDKQAQNCATAFDSYESAIDAIRLEQKDRPSNISDFFRGLNKKFGITFHQLFLFKDSPDQCKQSALADLIWGEVRDLSFEEIQKRILEYSPEVPEKPSIFLRDLYKEIGISLRQIQKSLNTESNNSLFLVSKIWDSVTYYESFTEAKEALLKALPERPTNIKQFFENDCENVIGMTGYRLRSDLLKDTSISWSGLADNIWGESEDLGWEDCKNEILKVRPLRPQYPSKFFREEMKNECGFSKAALLNRCPDTSIFTDLELANLIWGDDDNDPGGYIDELDISDAIAMFGDDPLRLKQFIKLYYPELDDSDVDRIVITSIEGLKPLKNEFEELHEEYVQGYNAPNLQTNLDENLTTDNYSFVLSGKSDTPYIQVIGAYTRKIRVRNDGSFSANIPLPRIGQINEFKIYGFDPEKKLKSDKQSIAISQTSIVSDTEEAFIKLIDKKSKIIDSLKDNVEKQNYFTRCLEMSLLRYFTKGEQGGFDYLEKRINSTESASMKKMLKMILGKFKKISSKEYNLNKGTRLYFFQKYCIHEILKAREEGKPGLILANEQGLGKTVTALALINGSPAAIISPNPVVSSWLEQEGKFIPESRLTSLEGSYKDRDTQLKETEKEQVVVNVEYMRGMNEDRAKALSSKAQILVIDEADYLGSKGSQQAKGTSMINPEFKMLLTATPFKKPSQITNLLKFLYPDNGAYGSNPAFARAFNVGDNADLNLLNMLLNENTIRVRKRDVFEEYDRSIALDKQSDKLPEKKIIEPESEASGQFDLTHQQSLSILELFDDYQGWCEKHKRSGEITDEDKAYAHFKEGFFQKKEALRQIMNDPAYIGSDESSPKHEAMDKLIEPRVEDGKKGLIFCRYKAQVEKYAKRYADLGVATYYGDLESNSNGYKVDSDGKVQYYKVDEFENPIFVNGEFIETTKEHGKPIRAFDYQRIKFQNDPNTKIMIATYDAGSVGVTFTAADFVVFDDLAQTYRDEYQAMDRAHRIDNSRKKYEVEYLWLQAKYPESFMSKLNDEIRSKYFDCGTYDEIHRSNIQSQSKIFHRILDGIGSDDELNRLSSLKNEMPFLFDGDNS